MQIEELRSKYKDAVIAIAHKYHADNVRVFGSVARGEATKNSDIDILVRFQPGASLLDEAGLARELNQLLGQRVDIIGDDTLRSEFKPFILNESVPL
jgi:predicted nucleotidyltransferase